MEERSSDQPTATGESREVSHQQHEAYEPPQMKVIGTLSELTWGTVSASDSDGVFPGSAV
jgi:hypothetical protein